METNEQNAIQETIQAYFQGLHRSDEALLSRAFDPAATVCGYGGDGSLKTLSLGQFLGFVKSLPIPANNGEPFDMEVLSVDIKGRVAAVKVRDLYQGRDFTDYLHLIKRPDGEWRIYGKVFHGEPRA